MTKGFNVFINDTFYCFIPSRSIAACKKFVRGYVQSTHMGQWRRTLTIKPENIKSTCFEYEYATTIGEYIRFSPATD